MDLYRFYVPDLAAQSLELPEDQAHHALRVLRLAAGSPVVVFDGAGGWAEALVHPAGRSVRVEITGVVHHDAPPTRPLTLLTAVPKGDRADWLIEQASQLNVAAIGWLEAERSVVRPKESGGKLEKWRRHAIESAKQCGRTHVLRIQPPRPLADLLRATEDRPRLCLDPRSTRPVALAIPQEPGPIAAFIGPEGGWSAGELELLAAPRVTSVRLTPTILRIETACAALAALVNCR